jgi:hypothetical protein
LRFALVHDIDSVADAFGVTEINGFANVETESVGRDEAGSEFASVKADVDLRVDAVEVIQHEHLAVIFGHGQVAVFGHDEVEAENARIDRGDFEGQEGLGEDLLRREASENLIKEPYLDGAGFDGVGSATVFDEFAGSESLIQLVAILGDIVLKGFVA